MAVREGRKVALFVPSLVGGGAERVMVNIANGLANRDVDLDLVLVNAIGPFLAEVSPRVRVIDLKSARTLTSLPKLVGYLRRERPKAMLSALNRANLVALWAGRLSGSSTRMVVSVHNTLSVETANTRGIRARIIPALMRYSFPWADTVVAVSLGVAEDLVHTISQPRERVQVIHNPVVSPRLHENANCSLDHPWFAPAAPPVVLGVGRLYKSKDFPLLIRAFALVRKERPARLMILGEGEDRPTLEALVRYLGLEEDVKLPGFVENPYQYMKAAAVFALSSRWEGFGLVLVEAMAVGTPVVSTDCLSGPAEILEDGKWGRLVPVGDAEALAGAIISALDDPPDPECLHRRAMDFSLERVTQQYLEVLDGEARDS